MRCRSRFALVPTLDSMPLRIAPSVALTPPAVVGTATLTAAPMDSTIIHEDEGYGGPIIIAPVPKDPPPIMIC